MYMQLAGMAMGAVMGKLTKKDPPKVIKQKAASYNIRKRTAKDMKALMDRKRQEDQEFTEQYSLLKDWEADLNLDNKQQRTQDTLQASGSFNALDAAIQARDTASLDNLQDVKRAQRLQGYETAQDISDRRLEGVLGAMDEARANQQNGIDTSYDNAQAQREFNETSTKDKVLGSLAGAAQSFIGGMGK